MRCGLRDARRSNRNEPHGTCHSMKGHRMTTSIPLWLLAVLGTLSLTMGTNALAADPSQWTCETCPFETKSSAVVDVGVGAVTDRSAKFGDLTGLDRQGGFAIAGGEARYRGKDGLYGN